MYQVDRISATAPTMTAEPGADCTGQEQVHQNLAPMDHLDFEGWNNRNWGVFCGYHTDDVKVFGFGSTTEGINPHTEWVQTFIAASPESKIMTHPIRIGARDWTGVMDDGTVMVTIARWANGRIAEEYLFTLSG